MPTAVRESDPPSTAEKQAVSAHDPSCERYGDFAPTILLRFPQLHGFH
jgi:hypothetical protein